jgi:hypothetical protein
MVDKYKTAGIKELKVEAVQTLCMQWQLLVYTFLIPFCSTEIDKYR